MFRYLAEPRLKNTDLNDNNNWIFYIIIYCVKELFKSYYNRQNTYNITRDHIKHVFIW